VYGVRRLLPLLWCPYGTVVILVTYRFSFASFRQGGIVCSDTIFSGISLVISCIVGSRNLVGMAGFGDDCFAHGLILGLRFVSRLTLFLGFRYVPDSFLSLRSVIWFRTRPGIPRST
jgi:hypothetical protein